MVQVILGLIIIILGICIFRFYPLKKGDITSLVISSMMIMITLICKRFFTIPIPLFGLESLKVGIEYIPLMLAGFILSPGYAFIIGLCSDLVGLLLVPTGFPFLGFTLTMILVCLIPSLVKEISKNMNETILKYGVECLLVIMSIIACIYIYIMEGYSVSSTTVILTYAQKIMLISLVLILLFIYLGVIRWTKHKMNVNSKELSIWMLSVVLVERICTIALTPLWLELMYGLPYVVSLCIRVIKECFVLPIEIFVGYTLLKIINRVYKK